MISTTYRPSGTPAAFESNHPTASGDCVAQTGPSAGSASTSPARKRIAAARAGQGGQESRQHAPIRSGEARPAQGGEEAVLCGELARLVDEALLDGGETFEHRDVRRFTGY
jgi:hypothetical protein